jgi:N-acetylmuramoyl-L-alanine amidase
MTKEANRLAGITRHQLVLRGVTPSNYLGRDGIQPRSDLAGLNLSTTPKVMIECGNMKNSVDAADLRSLEWRQNFAGGLADAISVFLRSRS